jgi:methylglutaconyl-CoA hydratase
MNHLKHFLPVSKPLLLNTMRVEHLSNGVVRFVLSRPEVRNAFDEVLVSELQSCLQNYTDRSEMRLLVLQGEGHMFCAGADLDYMKRQADQSFEKNFEGAKILGSLFYDLASFPVPVVAAVRGAAIGGGFGLVACADSCIAEANAIFATSEVRLGLVPGVIAPFLVRKLGLAFAQRPMLSGVRNTADAFVACGLVSRLVCDGHNFEDALENEILQFLEAGPLAARRCKQLLLDCAPLPTQALRDATAHHIATARAESESTEGLRAFFEKHSPSWQKDLLRVKP